MEMMTKDKLIELHKRLKSMVVDVLKVKGKVVAT